MRENFGSRRYGGERKWRRKRNLFKENDVRSVHSRENAISQQGSGTWLLFRDQQV